ncbi:hypothetical protein LV89_03480 [Arcicella aurantiaca]|uniref:Transposase IS200-like domain-containing protein n=1 Tax=Arcicella aurantiaca TaxID=591202 RepID=A0A316DVZ3_9BACT|nr:hypothetical protein [Arcicella aurantiaca]PWK22095.1 hypothetical protein LV89_03480 [Arcicella aurantiaca]
MKKNIELLEPMRVYHIYNRGINGENIFKEERNYKYFLQKYAQYIEPIADTFAYCLLKNHFHIAIRTKSEAEIIEFYVRRKTKDSQYKEVENTMSNADSDNVGKVQNLADVKPNIPSASHIISKQFSFLFNSYAQAINKGYSRTGGLFEEPFRRILVNNDAYFTELIYYIHHNPQKHGFVNDFRTYSHSSYHSHLSNALTKLKREEVLEWFGNNKEFERFHLINQDLKNLDSFRIEFD